MTVKNLKIFAVIIVLLCAHIYMGHIYIPKADKKFRAEKKQFYTFKPEAYKILSLGFDDLVSRINVLYSMYHPLNMNIPSIDFKRLISAMEGSRTLDEKNISPYLHIVYYWSWAKDAEAVKQMTRFLKGGVDNFPKNWDIPYAIYDIDAENRVYNERYLLEASKRAAKYGGPYWLINYPAKLSQSDGKVTESFLWLFEAYKITSSEKHRRRIFAAMKNISSSYSGEDKEKMNEILLILEQK